MLPSQSTHENRNIPDQEESDRLPGDFVCETRDKIGYLEPRRIDGAHRLHGASLSQNAGATDTIGRRLGCSCISHWEYNAQKLKYNEEAPILVIPSNSCCSSRMG
jgi:hypothetical protein